MLDQTVDELIIARHGDLPYLTNFNGDAAVYPWSITPNSKGLVEMHILADTTGKKGRNFSNEKIEFSQIRCSPSPRSVISLIYFLYFSGIVYNGPPASFDAEERMIQKRIQRGIDPQRPKESFSANIQREITEIEIEIYLESIQKGVDDRLQDSLQIERRWEGAAKAAFKEEMSRRHFSVQTEKELQSLIRQDLYADRNSTDPRKIFYMTHESTAIALASLIMFPDLELKSITFGELKQGIELSRGSCFRFLFDRNQGIILEQERINVHIDGLIPRVEVEKISPREISPLHRRL